MPSEKIEIMQWVYVALISPLFGAVGGWFSSWIGKWRSSKRREKGIVSHLSGLPLESKAILIDFHQNGTHTRRADPSSPAIRVLISSGLVAIGTGGGTYDAVDSYITISPEVWEVMDAWVASDFLSIASVKKEFFDFVNTFAKLT